MSKCYHNVSELVRDLSTDEEWAEYVASGMEAFDNVMKAIQDLPFERQLDVLSRADEMVRCLKSCG